jgi:hypothetical protein
MITRPGAVASTRRSSPPTERSGGITWPDVHPVAAGHLDQLRVAQQAVFVEAAAHEAEGEARSVHGQLADRAQQIRQRPDVVQVPVGEDDRVDRVAALLEVGEVGQHEVDADLLAAREGDAAVDDHEPVAELDDVEVLADLPRAAQGDHP